MRVLLLILASATVVAPHGIVPEGQRLVARMTRTIATAPSLGPDRIADVTEKGAEFTATLMTQIVDERGRPKEPEDAVVRGHVVRSSPGAGLSRAVLELAVDRIGERPVDARIDGLEAEQIVSVDPGTHVESTAFWGMLMGGISFGVPGVMLGYGAGGLSGGADAVKSRRTDAWISAGTLITIELTAPLMIDRCVASADVRSC